MAKIEVKLNPDVTPSGSDLAVCNAARRSFNTRSEWDTVILSQQELEESGDTYNDWQEFDQFYEPYDGYELRKLKEKDKRLIQFLARGMTAEDFDHLLFNTKEIVWDYNQDPKYDFMSEEDAEKLRRSYEKELIEKLWQWRNTPTHDTPFNHCFISFEVKAPVFVARQLVKHEYLIMSEFSRRYITDDIEFYRPDCWRKAAPNKKQGSSEEKVNLVWEPEHLYEKPLAVYQRMIECGVAPEQARMVLPQSTMTEWTWSGTLGAFAKMCQLRLHPEAQYEARVVAKEVYKHLLEYYPVSAKALVEGSDV